MSAFGGKADMAFSGISLSRSLLGCKADMTFCSAYVCFLTQSGHELTQSGHERFSGTSNFQGSLRRMNRHQATRGLRKATRTAVTVLCNWNDMSKNTLYRLGQYELGVRGDDPTTTVSVKGGSAQRESSSRK